MRDAKSEMKDGRCDMRYGISRCEMADIHQSMEIARTENSAPREKSAVGVMMISDVAINGIPKTRSG